MNEMSPEAKALQARVFAGPQPKPASVSHTVPPPLFSSPLALDAEHQAMRSPRLPAVNPAESEPRNTQKEEEVEKGGDMRPRKRRGTRYEKKPGLESATRTTLGTPRLTAEQLSEVRRQAALKSHASRREVGYVQSDETKEMIASKQKSYWASLSPEERSAEMKRRMKKREGKAEPRKTRKTRKEEGEEGPRNTSTLRSRTATEDGPNTRNEQEDPGYDLTPMGRAIGILRGEQRRLEGELDKVKAGITALMSALNSH